MSGNIAEDSYWQQLVPVGDVSLHPRDGERKLYLQMHTSDEKYSDEMERELGLQLSAPRGIRTYVHAQPCILVPRILLTVALSEEADTVDAPHLVRQWGEPVGEVVHSEVNGIERRQIGNAQAWFYPSDRIIVLWECDIFHPYLTASKELTQDSVLTVSWCGFERILLDKFGEARQIITPGWSRRMRTRGGKPFCASKGTRHIRTATTHLSNYFIAKGVTQRNYVSY